jgi:hypothetical protein
MHALPFVISIACAALLAPALLRALGDGGHTRLNYRHRALPFPFGVLTLAAALLALIPLTLLQQLASTRVFHPETLTIALYALGVLGLGLLDDMLAPGAGGGAGAGEDGGSGPRAGAGTAPRRCVASSPRGRSRPSAPSAWRCWR